MHAIDMHASALFRPSPRRAPPATALIIATLSDHTCTRKSRDQEKAHRGKRLGVVSGRLASRYQEGPPGNSQRCRRRGTVSSG